MAERARLTGGESTIKPLPQIGVSDGAAKNLETFAAGIARVGERVQDQLDIQAIQEGERAGLIAGLGPKFQALNEPGLRQRAYDRAGLNIFVNQTEIRTQQKIDELYEKHRADPVELEAQLNAWRDGFRSELATGTPQAVPYFDNSFQRNSRPVIRAAEEEYRRTLAEEARASLSLTLESDMNAAARLAYLSDADPRAAGELTAARNAFIDRMVEHGPKQEFSFAGRTLGPDITRNTALSLPQMQKALSDFDEQAASQTVLGRFSRAPDKKAFAAEFSDRERKDPSSALSLPALARVEARMASVIEAEDRVEMQRLIAAEKAERAAEKREKEIQEANAVTAFDAYRRGVLTPAVLDAAGRNRLISRSVWESFATMLEKDPPTTRDDAAELFHADRINQGVGSRTDILADPRLLDSTKQSLLDKLDAHARRPEEKTPYQIIVTSQEYQRANDALRRDIITTGPLAALSGGEAQRLNRAYRELDDRLKQGIANGSIKSSADVDALYDDIAPRYRSEAELDKRQGLEKPRYGDRPLTVEQVAALREKLRQEAVAGRIGPSEAAREQLLLEEYERLIAATPPPAARGNSRSPK